MINKVVYVKAHFEPVGKDVKKLVPTGEREKFLGFEMDKKKEIVEWEQTGWSDCLVDGERLAQDTEIAIKKLNEEGYEVATVTPVTSGNYSHYMGGNGGYGYGFGTTRGVIIVARQTVCD